MKTRGHSFTRKKIDFILDFYFSGESDRKSDRKIWEWLLDDRDRGEKDLAMKRIWDECVYETEPDLDAVASLVEVRRKLAFAEPPVLYRSAQRKRRKLFGIAAASVVLCVLAGTLLLTDRHNPAKEHSAPLAALQQTPEVQMRKVSAGERAVMQVDLPDGSKVWIHRHGSISYPENFETNRTLNMEGEACFSVVKQNGDPFVVNGDGVSVKVLGTEFLVETGSDGAEGRVEVATGTVEVTVSGKTHKIETRQRLVYKEQLEEVLLSQLLPGEEVASWKEMDLVFNGQTLNEAFDRIATYYNVVLSIDNALSVDRRLTVEFAQDETLENVLDVLSHMSGEFGYEINDNNVTINNL
jgi:ferric-dicitrate binding protein FerR (iron transport regulator)